MRTVLAPRTDGLSDDGEGTADGYVVGKVRENGRLGYGRGK